MIVGDALFAMNWYDFTFMFVNGGRPFFSFFLSSHRICIHLPPCCAAFLLQLLYSAEFLRFNLVALAGGKHPKPVGGLVECRAGD